MTFALAPTAENYRLEAFDTIGSTNAVALQRAQAGDPGKLWIVSKKQEAGRGRRGRPWQTPEGNLAATVLVVGRYEPKIAATLGFVAGLALADALNAVVPQKKLSVGIDGGGAGRNRFELKWPNDVLAHGAKLSGILLESMLLPDGRFAIAVGIGVNVVAYPDDVPYPATSLRALGADCDAETLFLALSDAWVDNHARWAEGRGLDDIRRRWLDQAAGLGSEVAVRQDGRIVRGIFETIDSDCQFVIRDRQGVELRIAVGDVHFGAVASADAD
ncbi:BirA family transcriptional regulator, biotin operon repressor / biotin-[acetyl-CoA-carboxylase] ligase [Mesorhizobium albiziae]|uniref:biotin--[biotin carboxyl-carrier protein] ligase n=1 Tax=Neomesorhizobium albiziae TaxID=335020 RepID=A0A1I3UXW9_9HYPH|nr:biotin--[acetyl-CoA-carboxylase] ligase [Mesorhizobium albiziae]GLS28496.1 biotin--[acetyl-CoA-carboxylase] ligase [Mesorhizobium albiziae]SFJ86926.1 BirA family transcriptional regulator, biotin operon repressor / biotin-[acetyl-CoA-carboxylase] ligase [Mesorhizobium albiziae]